MPLPAIAGLLAGLVGRLGAAEGLSALAGRLAPAVARGAGQAAAGEAAAGAGQAASAVGRVNWKDPELFRRAFTAAGPRSSPEIAADQASAESEARGKQQAADALKNLGRAATGSVVALIGLPKALGRFAEGLAESQRHLARYNGQQAGAFARLDRDRLGRDINRAQGTGATTAALVDALNGLERELAPVKTALANVANIVGVGAAIGARIVVFQAKLSSGFFILQGIHALLQRWLPQRPQNLQPWQHLLGDIADGKYAGRRQPPPVPPRRRPPGAPGGRN